MMDKIIFAINCVVYAHFLASIICAITPTPKDNEMMAKGYKLIEKLALNVYLAKMKSK